MKKIGILTFHYSNNYGAILQALCLQKVISLLGYNVEIINYIRPSYKPTGIANYTNLHKDYFCNDGKINSIINILNKMIIMIKYNKSITDKCNIFRNREMNLSKLVDMNSLKSILNDYEAIIVGSDQIWNPSQRKNPLYFLDFGGDFSGKKISYAADSSIQDVTAEEMDYLKKVLNNFSAISVRNKHSYEFVKTVTNQEVEIVADPTLLFDSPIFNKKEDKKAEYILTYVLGKEIVGSHKKVIEKIKNKYGNIPVYSIKNPTMSFELSPFADKVFYDLSPDEWINMLRNARFIYTDSYHGVLFSLKYHKPFLAYYTEKLRAGRFIDIGKRYGIDKYIVQNITEVDELGSLDTLPDFDSIDKIIDLQKKSSIKFLEKSLSEL